MAKIVIIGAGSGFGGRLSIDILSREALRDSEICLCDIHPGRLEAVRAYVDRTIQHHKLPATVRASGDRRELLPGADFVVTSVSVGGGAYYGYPFNVEVEIPRKYGIDQGVADTVSVGAVFRFLRTAPVQQAFFRDMEELCPNATVLNHTNPMAMLSWIHLVDTKMRYAGLCHGVQGTSREMAKFLGIPWEELKFSVAGINHLAWFTELYHNGEDVYPKLFEAMEDEEIWAKDPVRFEIMRHFGYFPTESSRHDSEYLPYFRRTPELMKRYLQEPREVPMEQPNKRVWAADTGVEESDAPIGELKLSHEYSSGIMNAIVTDVPYTFQGNVMNENSLINNLPGNCCVEVKCVVDSRGIHPTHFGDLPPHLAALCRSNVGVQEMAVRAYLDRDREAAFHACCLDPNAAAVVGLDDIRKMFEELWEAEKDLLLYYDKNYDGPIPEICAP